MSTLREDIELLSQCTVDPAAKDALAHVIAHLEEGARLLRETELGVDGHRGFRAWSDAIDVWLKKDRGRTG